MDLLGGSRSLQTLGQVEERSKLANGPRKEFCSPPTFTDVPAKRCSAHNRSVLIAQRDDCNLHGEGSAILTHPDGFEGAKRFAAAHASDHVLGG
jgi:hypothetical protein